MQLQPLAPESSLSYSHLSHSVSSHLDSSPESSEAGADIPLSHSGKMVAWQHCVVAKREDCLSSTNCFCLLRAAADPEGRPEHRGEGGPSPLQSPGAGRPAATPSPVPPGPQEAEEQPLSERGAPQRPAGAARQAAQPRAETRHLGRQPVQQHGRGARAAGDLDPAPVPAGHHQEPDAPGAGLRSAPQEEALTLFRGHRSSSEFLKPFLFVLGLSSTLLVIVSI